MVELESRNGDAPVLQLSDSQLTEFTKSWPIVELRSVAQVIMGQSPDGQLYNQDKEGKPLITGAGQFGEFYPEPKQYSRSGPKVSIKGDIIICIRATIGDLNWSDRDYYLGRGVAGIRVTDKIDSLYLWYLLRTRKSDLESFATGSTFKQIKREDVETIMVPLPLLAEQRRIATILDKADDLRRKRLQAIAKLDALLQSVFLEMFGDPVTNPKGWNRQPLQAFGVITTGNTPSRAQSEYYGPGIEWIKSDNINTPLHFLTQATETLSAKGKSVGRSVTAGSILVTCIAGSPDCIGNAAIADREVAFNQQINAITLNQISDVNFLYTQILVGKRLIQQASTASMKGMVSKRSFSEIEMMCPPAELRQAFSQRFAHLYALQQKCIIAERNSEQLFRSLQRQYF